jgi:drug/metabolite transporter (DMT)-like permease
LSHYISSVVLAAVALALVAAGMHGTWNVLVKTSADPLTTFYRATISGAAIFTLPALIAFAIVRPGFNIAAVGLVVLSAGLEVAYMWLLSSAYARGELSVVYPIARGSAPLLAVVIGLGLIGERLSGAQLVGVALLLAGILAVTLPQTSGRATVPALLTGVAIASYTSIDRVGVRLMEPWLYGWMLLVLMAAGMAVTVPLRRRRDEVEVVSWRLGTAIGLISWSAYLLVLVALSLAPLAIVAPVRELAIVAVAIWGVWRLGERKAAPLKLAGAGATLVGIALLAA